MAIYIQAFEIIIGTFEGQIQSNFDSVLSKYFYIQKQPSMSNSHKTELESLIFNFKSLIYKEIVFE